LVLDFDNAPDRNEKSDCIKPIFLVYKERLKKAPIDLEKKVYEGGLVMNSWIRHMINFILFYKI
jgi:hypothetical protein